MTHKTAKIIESWRIPTAYQINRDDLEQTAKIAKASAALRASINKTMQDQFDSFFTTSDVEAPAPEPLTVEKIQKMIDDLPVVLRHIEVCEEDYSRVYYLIRRFEEHQRMIDPQPRYAEMASIFSGIQIRVTKDDTLQRGEAKAVFSDGTIKISRFGKPTVYIEPESFYRWLKSLGITPKA